MFRTAVRRPGRSRRDQMTHSWLITGPPDPINLAYAFATALISGDPDGDGPHRIQVVARSHPDLHVLATEGVIIKPTTCARSCGAPTTRRPSAVTASSSWRMPTADRADLDS